MHTSSCLQNTGWIGECDDLAFEQISEWLESDECPYTEGVLLEHKLMFDLMCRDKEGLPKENLFLSWCRRVAAIKSEVDSTATKHAETPLETRYYKSLDRDIFASEDHGFQICENRKT